MFCSNVLFGQGPWTPWQMFAMGIMGLLAGVLLRKGFYAKEFPYDKLLRNNIM